LAQLLADDNHLVSVSTRSVPSIPSGYRITNDVPPNGDCGFIGIARGSGVTLSAFELREQSNQIIINNPDAFREEMSPETVESYTTKMARFAIPGIRSGAYCEAPSIAAMAVLLRRIIITYEQRDNEIALIERTFTPRNLEDGHPKIMVYNSFNRQHFECVIAKTDASSLAMNLITPPITPKESLRAPSSSSSSTPFKRGDNKRCASAIDDASDEAPSMRVVSSAPPPLPIPAASSSSALDVLDAYMDGNAVVNPSFDQNVRDY
jgi:hypothetical protein